MGSGTVVTIMTDEKALLFLKIWKTTDYGEN